jgi:multidrug efflux system outer membrane protein
MRYALLFLLLASCTFYPKYERPGLEDPSAWRETLDTQNAVDVGWWKQFDDSTLDGLIELALANNQDLQTAIARVDQFQAQLLVAKSTLYPQVTGGSLEQRQKISTSVTALPPGVQQVFNLFGFLFQASYLVDLWGEVRSGVEAAYHSWLSAIEARRVVVLGLVSSVSSAYIQLRQFDEQLIISRETLQSRKDSLYLAKIRFELGLTSELEVEQAISEVEEAQVEVENFQILVAQTENLLSFLTGSPSREIPRGLTLAQATMPPSVPAVLPSELLNQRPDIKAAEERLIAANANIGVAKAQFFPKINLGGAAGAESIAMNQLFTNASKIWEFGSTTMQQIFTGFALTGNLDVAKAEKEEALHAYLSAVLKGFQEVNNALVAHKVYLEQVETEKQRVEALEKYLYLSDLRYKEGQIDYLTFLDAERQLFRGLLDFETAKANSFLSYIQIYQSLGGGWVTAADKQAMEAYD